MLKINSKIPDKTNQESQEFIIERKNDKLWVNGLAEEFDIVALKPNLYHIIINHQPYRLEVLEADYKNKVFKVKVNHTLYELEAKNRVDLLLKELGMDQAISNKISELKAPMPGSILDIQVEVGQNVQSGDALIILEAMKMENVIKSPSEGVIKSIQVKKGQNVDKNDVLIYFE